MTRTPKADLKKLKAHFLGVKSKIILFMLFIQK